MPWRIVPGKPSWRGKGHSSRLYFRRNVYYGCGITLQNIHGVLLPEIGYHIRKDQQRRGYASEAAGECIRYAFENHDFPAVYSYMKYTNTPSRHTAMKNGMQFVEEYEDPDHTVTCVYAITRKEWEAQYET